MAVPTLDAIRRATGWSSVVDLDTEEGRTFLQDRLAFLGKVAFVLSVAVEWSQLYSHSRFPSVQDVLCDVCGALIGGWQAARRRGEVDAATD